MGDREANALTTIVAAVFLIAVGSCMRNKLEVKRLTIMNGQLKKDAEESYPNTWIGACKHGVNMACYFSDCATVSIDEMQERICRKDQIP